MVEPGPDYNSGPAVRRQAQRAPETWDDDLDVIFASSSRPVSRHSSPTSSTTTRSTKSSCSPNHFNLRTLLLPLLSASPAAMAACISLQGSTACSAFQSASVSTDPAIVGLLYVLPHLIVCRTASRDITHLKSTQEMLTIFQSFSSVRF